MEEFAHNVFNKAKELESKMVTTKNNDEIKVGIWVESDDIYYVIIVCELSQAIVCITFNKMLSKEFYNKYIEIIEK